jgi:hypothetical protein
VGNNIPSDKRYVSLNTPLFRVGRNIQENIIPETAAPVERAHHTNILLDRGAKTV